MKKIELEDLLRNYLTHHYRMSHPSLLFHCLTGTTCTDVVSGNTTHHVPFASLEKATSKFVSPQYLPASFIIQDPHNLKKQEIQSFLLHIKQRQEWHNPEEVFHFRGYERRGKEELEAALYPDSAIHDQDRVPAPQKQHQTKARLAPPKSGPPVANDGPSRMATPFTGIATLAQSLFNTGLSTPSPTPGTHPDDVSYLAMPASDVLQSCVATSRLILSQSQMNGIIARGVKPVEPHNGPNEGDPVYEVQATLVK